MWQEDDSQVFLRYGPLFIPRREEQIETMSATAWSRSEP